MKAIRLIAIGVVLGSLWANVPTANAQTSNVVSDNFTGTSASLQWAPFHGACLTAGNGTGSIPACSTLAYYSGQSQTGLYNNTPANTDSSGNGALRLTNGCANGTCYYDQNGAIISTTPFASGEGIQVTFTTYTYGGDNNGGHGADGIGFYLLNGADANEVIAAAANPSDTGNTNTWTQGSWGGSLGYSCSNTNSPYPGMTDAYLGLGMDEFGNFLNAGDNTGTGALNSSLATSGTGVQTGAYSGTASGSGPEYQPGRIGLRGYGNISLISLQAVNPNATTANVQTVCANGGTYSYKNSSNKTVSTTFPDYAAIPNGYVNLPSTTPISKESATSRAAAVPISYKLQITQNGLLSLWYSWNSGNYVAVLTNQSISASNGTMPSSFLFGFGGSTGGSDNVHEITCFQATPATQAASSVGINVQQTSQVDTGTQIYVAYYHTNNWWGQLQAIEVLANANGTISFASTPWWDASCVLTGGNCAATGVQGMTAQGSGSRTLMTWSGTAGIPFTWGRLTTTEQGWLNNDNEGQNRVAYLSGDRTNEINTQGQGLFRNRTSVLADIIDSSPTWVGAPDNDYPNTWTDLTNPSDTLPENQSSAQTYSAFETAYATRTDVVYEGANDGFMHGFRSGYYTSGGTYAGTTTAGVFVPTDNDGQEVMAYMPQAVLQTIHNASDPTYDYSSTHYGHNYFVDSTPGTGDLFYGSQWHTWLVSGLGAGGNAIFAMDITNPGSNGADSGLGVGNVIGEWSNSSNSPLVCTNDTTSSQCINDLGQTYGTPQIRRLHNGEWGIIFGNGLNSATGIAGIYVMTISSAGTIDKIYFLSTGVGSPSGAQGPNGIAFVTPADLDGDHITDYVYAGDAWGNVWRFDLTSSSAANWGVTQYPNSTNGALFTTPSTTYHTTVSGSTVTTITYQPITTQVLALATQPVTNGNYYVMLEFGTGSVTPQTNTSGVEYTGGPQALYGIWDWMQGVSGTPGAKYASTSSPGTNKPITQSVLEQQVSTTFTAATGSYSTSSVPITQYETVTANTICFVGMTCGTSSGTQYGWYLNLVNFEGVSNLGVSSTTGQANQTEQVIYSPVFVDGAFIVDTTIPTNNSPLTCSVNTPAGFTMGLNPVTGGAFPESFFEAPTGGFGLASNGQAVSGVGLGATGSASILSVGSHANLVAMTPQGPVTTPVNPQQTANGSRVTWIQLH
jgi:type IV pilus assembly protein PilY1